MKYFAYYGHLDLFEFMDFHYIAPGDTEYTQIFSAMNLESLLVLMTSNFKAMARDAIEANYPLDKRNLPMTVATELSHCMVEFANGLREVNLSEAHDRHLFEDRLKGAQESFTDREDGFHSYFQSFKMNCILATLPEDLHDSAKILMGMK